MSRIAFLASSLVAFLLMAQSDITPEQVMVLYRIFGPVVVGAAAVGFVFYKEWIVPGAAMKRALDRINKLEQARDDWVNMSFGWKQQAERATASLAAAKAMGRYDGRGGGDERDERGGERERNERERNERRELHERRERNERNTSGPEMGERA